MWGESSLGGRPRRCGREEGCLPCVCVCVRDIRMFAARRCVLQSEMCLCQQFLFLLRVARTLTWSSAWQINSRPILLLLLLLLPLICSFTSCLLHRFLLCITGPLLVNANNMVLSMTTSRLYPPSYWVLVAAGWIAARKRCKQCPHMCNWGITHDAVIFEGIFAALFASTASHLCRFTWSEQSKDDSFPKGDKKVKRQKNKLH